VSDIVKLKNKEVRGSRERRNGAGRVGAGAVGGEMAYKGARYPP